MEYKPLIAKLTRKEFEAAIKKGLGRALIHTTEFGLNDVADLVLDACLNNYCYDIQIESSRASWLFSIFKDKEQYLNFSKRILNSLKTETNEGNLAQLFGLAKEMAKHGNENAKQKLRESAIEKAIQPLSDDWMSRHEWVEIEGIKGFLELARIYGQRLLQDPEDFVPDDLVYSDETKKERKDALFRFSETDSKIKVYKDYLESRGVFKVSSKPIDKELIKQKRHERIRKEYSLESILKDASDKVGELPRYMMFGKHATADELEKVYSQLFIETDKDVLLRLLWVFRRTPLPRLGDLIFNWATGKDNELREAAINALAQNSHKRIHDLAILKIKNREICGADKDALDLFLNNFESNDSLLIAESLFAIKAETEDAHSLGFSIRELSSKYQNIELSDSLKWVYENTPCSLCRGDVVEKLQKLKQLSKELIYECQFDVVEDIRKFVIGNTT